MKRRSLLGLAALACCMQSHAADATRRIVLASMIEQEATPSHKLLLLIYTEAFRQLGIEVQFRIFPAARAQAEAMAGTVDGEVARSLEYESMQPVLMRVAESPMSIGMAAYARDPAIHLSGLESLRGTGYRVEFRSGYPVIARILAGLVPPDKLSQISHVEQGLRKVQLGRIDLYVDAEELIDPILAASPPELANVRKAGVLERRPIFLYLNRRHAELAPRVAEVLRKMRASGQLDQLHAQVFGIKP
jgi:polar amino acid transport system substrate-binding protein